MFGVDMKSFGCEGGGCSVYGRGIGVLNGRDMCLKLVLSCDMSGQRY